MCRLDGSDNHKKRSLITPKDIRIISRIVSMFMKLGNELYSDLFYVEQAIVKRVVYMYNICWIRYSEELGTPMTSACVFVSATIFVGWCIVLWCASFIFHTSQANIESWKYFHSKNRVESLTMEKFAKAT